MHLVMSESLKLTEVITAIVAAYGALLATYNVIALRREKKPQIEITLSSGVRFDTSGQPSKPMLFLKAANRGDRVVTLNSHGVRLPDKTTLYTPVPISDVSFPFELQKDKSCTVYIPLEELERDLRNSGYENQVKLVGIYADMVGRKYRSKRLTLDLHQIDALTANINATIKKARLG